MSSKKHQADYTCLYLRAPTTLDTLVEAMAREERRTKTVVLTLALEEYAERHHPDLFGHHKAVAK